MLKTSAKSFVRLGLGGQCRCLHCTSMPRGSLGCAKKAVGKAMKALGDVRKLGDCCNVSNFSPSKRPFGDDIARLLKQVSR